MRETKSSIIGKYKYSVTQLGATDSRKVLMRITKVFGSGMGAKEPIPRMLAALNDDDVQFLCDTFSAVTCVQMNEKQAPQLNTIYEEHFAGNIMGQLKWLAFCVEVNFGDFLAEIGLTMDALSQAADKAKANLLTSPKEQTGQSGDPSTPAG